MHKHILFFFWLTLAGQPTWATNNSFNYCDWLMSGMDEEIYTYVTGRLKNDKPMKGGDFVLLGSSVEKAISGLNALRSDRSIGYEIQKNASIKLNRRLRAIDGLMRKRILSTETYEDTFAAGLEDMTDSVVGYKWTGIDRNRMLKLTSLWDEYLARPFNLNLLFEQHAHFLETLSDVLGVYVITGDGELSDIGSRLLNRLVEALSVDPGAIGKRQRSEQSTLTENLAIGLWSFKLPFSRTFTANVWHVTKQNLIYDPKPIYQYLEKVSALLGWVRNTKERYPKSWKSELETVEDHEWQKLRFAKILMSEVYRPLQSPIQVSQLFAVSAMTESALKAWYAEDAKYPRAQSLKTQDFGSNYSFDQFVKDIRFVIGLSRLSLYLTPPDQPSSLTGPLARIAHLFKEDEFNELFELSRVEP